MFLSYVVLLSGIPVIFVSTAKFGYVCAV